ncbi:MAG: hypothetical protein KF730_15490 [Sphingomonas sp.]|uniref:hypothetical protein n=1 Tax=Sphingomonas sp. TaxID=28214 RepID=UPI0025F3B68B|nr:hypothetical protein [Sphingomonas sp.]MBX3565968.1 hypothetical protein [Sphingomonas sp.]
MLRVAGFAITLLTMAVPLGAQTVPAAADSRDKMAPLKMSYREQIEPWWVVLADCAAVHRQPVEDRAKTQAFATTAMARVAKDRGITIRDAGAVVMPHVLRGRGNEIAGVLVATYGGKAELAKGCDDVMAAYKSAGLPS